MARFFVARRSPAVRKDGAVVVLLHGFPEFLVWLAKQIEPYGRRWLSRHRTRLGGSTQQQPAGIAAYALSESSPTVIAIADQLGQQKFFW